MLGRLRAIKNRYKVFLNDEDRKGIFQICKEAIHFGIVKNELPYFYFGKFLYRKHIKNYTDYLSSKEVDAITLSKKLHHFSYATLLRNKLAFAFFTEKNNLPVPSLIGYNLKNRFYFKSQVKLIKSKEELKSYFEEVFEKINLQKIFIKPFAEMGGTGIFLLTKENLEDKIHVYGDQILSTDYLYQEVIEQHQSINTIYHHSVNTIRFDTYIDNLDTIHILCAYMRFGAGGSVLDNSSSGGCYVKVNIENGVLEGSGYQFMRYGGKLFKKHPDTNVIFDGFKIPYFKEACHLVKQAVSFIPDRIIGWDIAIGPKGPVLIEGNDNNSLLGPDISYGGLLKHPLLKEILEEA